MNKRIYFRYGIEDLEKLFKESQTDISTLKKLKEELLNRKTQRATSLLVQVKKVLRSFNNASPQSPKAKQTDDEPEDIDVIIAPVNSSPKPECVPDEGEEIDWDNEIEKLRNDDSKKFIGASKPIENKPEDLLHTWTVIEALSPQTYG